MTVTRINDETPLQFVRRNGPTLTTEIAQRFRIEQRDALRIMSELHVKGLVKRKGVSYAQGSGWQWEAVRP